MGGEFTFYDLLLHCYVNRIEKEAKELPARDGWPRPIRELLELGDRSPLEAEKRAALRRFESGEEGLP